MNVSIEVVRDTISLISEEDLVFAVLEVLTNDQVESLHGNNHYTTIGALLSTVVTTVATMADGKDKEALEVLRGYI